MLRSVEMDVSNVEWDSEYDPPNRLASKFVFNDHTMLVTGASGFMGKVFVEKLLRTCPKIKRIYAMIRPKRGRTPEERLAEVLALPLFGLLKETHGEEILQKIVPISGDCEKADLGLSGEDRRTLIEETNYILHAAATIRFDEPLKKTILLNTRGTKLMLEFAKEMKHLKVFGYISTAYCHWEEKVLQEEFYPPPADPHGIIRLVEMLDDDAVNKITKHIIGNSPNTYVFSKALSESLVAEEQKNIRLAVFRPSLVLGVWKEPLPGWVENINGPLGLTVAAGKGILRTSYCRPNGYIDMVPVDIAVNSMLVAYADVVMFHERCVYNITTTFGHKITWSKMVELGKEVTHEVPFNWCVWYPDGAIQTNKLVNTICVILLHYVPAVIVDAILILTFNKPILWNIQRRISKAMEVFDYFINNEWPFNNDESLAARSLMTETEKRIYKLDDGDLDYKEYATNLALGARRYVLKESDESLPTAVRHMKMMWVVDKVAKALLVWLFLHLLFAYFLVAH